MHRSEIIRQLPAAGCQCRPGSMCCAARMRSTTAVMMMHLHNVNANRYRGTTVIGNFSTIPLTGSTSNSYSPTALMFSLFGKRMRSTGMWMLCFSRKNFSTWSALRGAKRHALPAA